MPFVRCMHYDDDGNPISNGCSRQNAGCDFVHPSEPGWDGARPSRSRGGHRGGFGRGMPSERGGMRTNTPPSGPRRGTPFQRGSPRGKVTKASGSNNANASELSSSWAPISSPKVQSTVTSTWSTNGWGTGSNTGGNGGWGDSSGQGWGDASNNGWNVDAKEAGKEVKGKEKEEGKGKDVIEAAWEADNSDINSWGGGGNTWGTSGSWGEGNDKWSTGNGWGNNTSSWGDSGAAKEGTPGEKKENTTSKPSSEDFHSGPFSQNTASNKAQAISSWGPTNATSGSWPSAGSLGSTNAADTDGTTISTAATKTDKWKAVKNSMPPPPAPQRPSSVGSKVAENVRKKPPPHPISLPPIVESTPMDVDPVISTDSRPLTPAVTRDNNATTPRYLFSATASASSSRQGSVVPSESGSSRVPKSFKNMSRSQAKREWDQFIRHVVRLQRLYKDARDAETKVTEFKLVQHDQYYIKIGRSASNIMDGSCLQLVQEAQQCRQNYEKELSSLINFEETFDFPIQALVMKDEGVEKVREELSSMKRYIRDVKTWLEPVQGVLEELDTRTKTMLHSQPTATTATATTPGVANTNTSLTRDAESDKKITNALKHLKAKKIQDRLSKLEKKAKSLESTIDEWTSGNQALDFVQSKIEDFAYKEEEREAEEEEEEDNERPSLKKLIRAHREEAATLGTEVGEIATEVADLIQRVSTLEESMKEYDGSSAAAKSRSELADLHLEFDAMRQQNDRTSELLKQFEAQVVELRALAAMPSASTSNATQPTVEEIAAVILPLMKEEMREDITTVTTNMQKSVHEFIEENQSRAVQDIWKNMHPILNAGQAVHERLERKGIPQRPRSISTHASADSRSGAYTHPNHT